MACTPTATHLGLLMNHHQLPQVDGIAMLRSPLDELRSSAAAEQVIADGHRAFREAVNPEAAALQLLTLIYSHADATAVFRAQQASPYLG